MHLRAWTSQWEGLSLDVLLARACDGWRLAMVFACLLLGLVICSDRWIGRPAVWLARDRTPANRGWRMRPNRMLHLLSSQAARRPSRAHPGPILSLTATNQAHSIIITCFLERVVQIKKPLDNGTLFRALSGVVQRDLLSVWIFFDGC